MVSHILKNIKLLLVCLTHLLHFEFCLKEPHICRCANWKLFYLFDVRLQYTAANV